LHVAAAAAPAALADRAGAAEKRGKEVAKVAEPTRSHLGPPPPATHAIIAENLRKGVGVESLRHAVGAHGRLAKPVVFLRFLASESTA
jgi:hypothetical protein